MDIGTIPLMHRYIAMRCHKWNSLKFILRKRSSIDDGIIFLNVSECQPMPDIIDGSIASIPIIFFGESKEFFFSSMLHRRSNLNWKLVRGLQTINWIIEFPWFESCQWDKVNYLFVRSLSLVRWSISVWEIHEKNGNLYSIKVKMKQFSERPIIWNSLWYPIDISIRASKLFRLTLHGIEIEEC